jgi:CRP/FNR family transcriptional regulator
METTSLFLKTLNCIAQFAPLTTDTKLAMARHAVQRCYDTGQIIYIEGELAETVFLLESGWIKAVRMTRQGREQAMMFMRPVDIFGDIAAFSGTTYPGTVFALEAVRAWAIPTNVILDIIQKSPDLSLAIIRHLSGRVLQYVNLVEDLSLRSVEARLARTLLSNAEPVNGQMVVVRREWATYDEMAVRLGTVRDVLSRAMRTLEAENLLRVEKNAIILLDSQGLAKRADS